MTRTHWTQFWICLSIGVGSIGYAGTAQAADDTARFYGTWKASFPYNGQTVVMESVHDAKGYRNYVLIPEGAAPAGDGTFSAKDGNWSASATAPNDSGTYQFIDNNTAFCKNAIGQSLLWERDNTPLPPVIGAAGNAGNRLPAAANFAAVKTSQAIEVCRNIAQAWHADAFLVGVRVIGPSADGSVNILANPQAFNILFYSPSGKMALSVVSAAPVGTFYEVPAAAPANTILQPISAKAIDLTDAYKSAKLFGFNGIARQAEMSFEQKNGKPMRLVWVLDTDEMYPRLVSAATGAVLSPFEVFDDKVADYNKLAAETQAAVARMRQSMGPRRRGAQNNGGEWTSAGIHYWSGDSQEGSSGEHSSQDASGNSSEEEDNTYDNSVGAQNAWENGDSDAEARFDAGTPTETDQSSYSD